MRRHLLAHGRGGKAFARCQGEDRGWAPMTPLLLNEPCMMLIVVGGVPFRVPAGRAPLYGRLPGFFEARVAFVRLRGRGPASPGHRAVHHRGHGGHHRRTAR